MTAGVLKVLMHLANGHTIDFHINDYDGTAEDLAEELRDELQGEGDGRPQWTVIEHIAVHPQAISAIEVLD